MAIRWKDTDWGGELYQEVIWVDMYRTDWISAALALGPHDDAQTPREIADLLALIPERRHHRATIKEQDKSGGIRKAFEKVFKFNEDSKPATVWLLDTVIWGTSSMSFYAKNIYRRPRASQINPDVLKKGQIIIPMPPHPAYPSGHSFQSHLAARALADIGGPDDEADSLARSIALNREIAGLHYRSDSDAGDRYAQLVWPLLRSTHGVERAIALARREWRGGR